MHEAAVLSESPAPPVATLSHPDQSVPPPPPPVQLPDELTVTWWDTGPKVLPPTLTDRVTVLVPAELYL